MFFAGVDIGSATTKAVILDDGGRIVGHSLLPSGALVAVAAQKALDIALREAGVTRDQLASLISTGYGRESMENRTKAVTEITCHARGVTKTIPGTHLVIDIGGQDSKAIALADDGMVRNFVMNDKCAAGTGRFLEVMARVLEIDLERIGPMTLEADVAAKISSTCTVFAESEVVSLLAQGETRRRILLGICRSIAERVKAMAARVGIRPEVVMTGGVAKNVGVVKSIEESVGFPVRVPEEPQSIGALGAAFIARDLAGKHAK